MTAAPAAANNAAPAPKTPRRGVLAAYLALTKPRVIELLLVTTVPAMFLAQRGIPSPWLVLVTLAGGAMSAGSANALNCVADSDIDAVMDRTKKRPLVSYEVPRRSALVFGIVLGVVSFAVLALGANLLAAVLSLAAILFYVFVYTLVLKRRTSQNIVWGGAAGCMPVVIGWAAVTGSVEWPALVMFGVVFLWTPPHFWSLAMKYREDYARAGVPMLPVVATPRQVSARILVYSWATVACTLLLVPATSWVYVAFAVLAGAAFLIVAQRLHNSIRRGHAYNPMKLFHLSNSYLALLFVAIAVDSAVGLPSFVA
ncbi:protoheme IX farnesyltransferase [Saccharopolyspora erythraea NRRL 2338]|uniref:Protoheme IX farnesyltransferase 1 n=2 Tax=Saccharopolyspora erythraea TaxID=1836 RepID=COXX1_SACEN|nr:heme o synthase [Saccharopolyspora erythraea]A4F9B0.2 RecName: Full=Protoheme IX farnesyltransferase 1; AltName: Full=Heme B farnesyltransferase 1; AltName: Full=Heme O synthase 1 [Saccharopolyspora erythraea NRRL 2338]PFG94423.1 protoheme IX farnesyltransferase [Saccharopolyspora erythraea NRRL 2338]QRK91184.1 protoheme IX farnesyltransferase [Saccharopolyspora erythraea]